MSLLIKKKIDTTQNSKDSISGIYYAGKEKILVEKENDSLWYGIILSSDTDEWTQGKIRIRIKKTSSDYFEIFEYFNNGLLFYQKNIKIDDGRIHSTFWNKENNYFFNKNHKDNFTYKSINPSFDYIGIKTLKRSNKLIKEANNFYAENLPKINADNLIIDLRNNGGGAIKQAKPLLKFLKRNEEIKKIYVLINFKTASSAELTALKLKDDDRAILAGENSRGMIEYGYGNHAFSTKTNCSGYQMVVSTKQKYDKFSKYEFIGLTPDIYLKNKLNWINRIIKLDVGEK